MRTEPRKDTSKSAAAARVKALLGTKLGWLEGFPLEVADGTVHWMAVPLSAPALEMSLDGRHLSQATYALNKLRGELAPSLALLVDEPEAWMDTAEHRLERLKGAVHRGDRPSRRLFQEDFFPRGFREEASSLAAGELRLKPLLNALAWVHAGHPARARAVLEEVRDWGRGLESLTARLGEVPALIALLRLAQLAASHGRDRVEALAACLLDERIHDVALKHGPGTCQQILLSLGRGSKDPLPDVLPAAESLGQELARWCEDLVQQNRRAQQQALRLFELVTPLPLAARWASWWEATRRLLREAHRLRALPYERESRKGLRKQVKRHSRSAPPALDAADLLATLRQHTTAASALTAPLLRVLALVPAEASAPGRIHVAIYWSFLGCQGTPEPRVLLLLAGFERYLSQCLGDSARPGAACLAPWADILLNPSGYCETVEYDRLAGDEPRRTVLAIYDHLARVAARYGGSGGLGPFPAMQATELFLLAGDSDLAAECFGSLKASGEDFRYSFSERSAKLALRFCRERPERFAQVLKALTAQQEREGLHPSEWPEPVFGPLSTGAVGDLVREAIVARQLDRLLACGTKSVLLDAAGAQPPSPPVPGDVVLPGWAERYPPELHPALCRLAAVLGDGAELKARRWLADDLPDAGRLEREIQAIEQRLPGTDPGRQPALRTRLANLQARLASPAAPSHARLERLRDRLDRAWGRAVLDHWESAIDTLLPDALRRLLGIEELPPWLAETGPLSLLAAASRLPDRRRRLAYRLFHLRCGPPPWDLHDAPQNRRFLDSLPHLDWRPWLDGVGTVTIELPQASGIRRLHLALEGDPLEIFRMGAHFQTCLSPGDMNYYSVFANVADVNKRVLYARDDAGKVQGRCLLALTAQGRMLAFAPYCHDVNLGFGAICADFADRLASRMGTQRAVLGKVPVLVAPSWYDDGVRDLGGCYPALEKGSPLRRRLAAVRPGEILDELRRGLKPARLDETTLPLVLELPELQERPELVLPLLRLVAECRALPDESLVTAVRLALEAGAADLVRRLLLQPLTNHLRRLYRGPRWPYSPATNSKAPNLLLRLDPSRLLAVLRQTRETSMHDWLDERDGHRIEMAASALEALFRPNQARPLWQRLASDMRIYVDGDTRQRARDRLDALMSD